MPEAGTKVMNMSRKHILGSLAVALVLCAGAVAAGAIATRGGRPLWLGLLVKNPQPVDAGLFCHEHGVPEKFCTLCHEELKTRLPICTEHKLPEAICTICDPQAEQRYGLKMLCREHHLPGPLCALCNPALAAGHVASDWCPAHGVPASLCTLCRPELTARVMICPTHDLPQPICTLCRPELAKNFAVCAAHAIPRAFCTDGVCLAMAKLQPPVAVCPQHGVSCTSHGCLFQRTAAEGQATLPRVQLANPQVASAAGIETAVAQTKEVTPVVSANGEVGYDESRLAHVRSRVAGVIAVVQANLGDNVRAGDVLAVIDSADLGEAKAQYLAALPLVDLWRQNHQRAQTLSLSGGIEGKRVAEAEAELRRSEAELLKARQRLRNFALDDEQLAGLPDEPEQERNRLPIVAPLDGTIVRRPVVAGEAVTPTDELFIVADLRKLWLHLEVYEQHLPRIELGQPVAFRVPGLTAATFRGAIAWIDSEVNDQTRAIRVRAELDNPGGLLRANMFGRGEIEVGPPRTAMVVPADAVQWEGHSFVVFVESGPAQYEPRRVLVGQEYGMLSELAWADLPVGAAVVTTGSFLLKTELQRGAIGAGCCGE